MTNDDLKEIILELAHIIMDNFEEGSEQYERAYVIKAEVFGPSLMEKFDRIMNDLDIEIDCD
jgi:hypothetical protein